MYCKEPGYFKVLSFYGVPLYMHWSFPIGGVLVAFYFKSEPENIIYFMLGYVILVFIHELGHFAAARHMNLAVHALTISGGGGMCYCETPRSHSEAFLLYSGGLIAQIILFLVTSIYLSNFGYPTSDIGYSIYLIFTVANLLMFVINLIPSRIVGGQPNDGIVLLNIAKSYYGKA